MFLPYGKKMVRSGRVETNSSCAEDGDETTLNIEEVFLEFERWNDVLKDQKKTYCEGQNYESHRTFFSSIVG